MLESHNLKQEKPIGCGFRLTRLRTFAKLIRTVVEVSVALALLSWAFHHLPFALRISGEFLRRLAAIVASPLFVFLLVNAIVVALVAKSRREARDSSAGNAHEAAEDVLYDALVKNSRDVQSLNPKPDNASTVPAPPCHLTGAGEGEEEAVVYQDKEIILSQATRRGGDGGEQEETVPAASWSSSSDSDSDAGNPKVYRRAKSEKEIGRRRGHKRAMRRCETTMEKGQSPADELSDEEFQRTVDEFIAKQWKFCREESLLAMVVVNPSPNDLKSPLVESVRS